MLCAEVAWRCSNVLKVKLKERRSSARVCGLSKASVSLPPFKRIAAMAVGERKAYVQLRGELYRISRSLRRAAREGWTHTLSTQAG